LRRALAQEAARIMAEHGIRDFLIAKRKAAERMGVTDVAAVLPRNVEIEDALAEYQRLFGGESHVESLHAQRRAALNAMLYLHEFEPRLVGAVLSGTATEHSDVQLHLFTDRAESVTIKLMDEGIPHEVTEKRVRMSAERVLAYPGVRFELDAQSIEATVFPTDGIRQVPVSPVDGRPMRRASKLEVEALLDS
jgi:predicted nucleotidyltransferase